MELYKKQKMQMKAEISALSSDGSNVDKISPASGGEERVPVEHCSSPEHLLLGSSCNEEGGDRAGSNSKGDMSDDAKEHQSDNISNAVSGPVVSADDSQAFEALMPESDECRVNLSRIHIPPESTH